MLRSAEPIALTFMPAESASTLIDTGIDLRGHVQGDMGVFPVPFKCRVVMSAVSITQGWAGASAFGEVAFDRRFTAGSDTGRTDGDVGRIFFGNVTGASAQGDVVYDRAGTGVTLEPGMEVVVECRSGAGAVGSGAAGVVWPMLLVEYLPETRSNLSNMQETA
jgi:hypothetical protein